MIIQFKNQNQKKFLNFNMSRGIRRIPGIKSPQSFRLQGITLIFNFCILHLKGGNQWILV